MARPKEFDREQVLDRAIELFWARGYEATSVGDLIDHLKIGRQSLYDTFGDKRALYLAALDRYRQKYGDLIPDLLEGTGDIRKVFSRVFAKLIDVAVERPSKACMLVSAAAERCPSDREVAVRFCTNTSALERTFTERLARAQRERELAKHHDPAALAAYFVNAIRGLQIAGRGGMEPAALRRIADTTLAILH